MSVAFDARKNFALSTVATAPSTPTAGTSLIIGAGDGANFPAVPFNAVVWPTGANPSRTNAEIVRVTGKSTDTLTITRTQESSTNRSIVVGDQIMAGLTDKALLDIENVLNGVTSGAVLLTALLTTPQFANNGSINDDSANEQIVFHKTASAVNQVGITNAATANAPIVEAEGGDTNIHIVVRGKGNGLTKVSVLRQDDTTGTYKHNSVILTGWGVLTISTGARNFNETVTYGITFAQRPIIVGANGGDALTASGSAYGTGSNVISADWQTKCADITTTTFKMYQVAPANVGANGFVWYSWIAIGELA